MLKLRDFLHLPQLDAIFERLISTHTGLIILAGIDTHPVPLTGATESLAPSGLSAMYNILLQEILMADAGAQALVVSAEKTMARVPRQLQRRVKLIEVETPEQYAEQIDIAASQRPGLLVVDHLNEYSAGAAFRAAGNGLRVLTQFDTLMRGSRVGRHLIELGIPRRELGHLRWILTTQRLSTLCQRCRKSYTLSESLARAVSARFPHLGPRMGTLLRQASDGSGGTFFRPGTCERCHQSGYSGDMAVYDLFYNAPDNDLFDQSSLLSLEEYALHLAEEGQLDLEDLLHLESNHLRRAYQMLSASERALVQSNAELKRRLVELEAMNRVLVHRTEALMSLEDLGQAMISSTDLRDLASRLCRRASELCGADRVVLYARREQDGKEMAEVLAARGWDTSAVGRGVAPAQVFDRIKEGHATRYLHHPPGVRPVKQPGGEGESRLRMGVRVPLVAQERLVGVMIVQCTQKDSFTPGEMALLTTFGNQAALALQRAGLVEDLKAKIDELQTAQGELVKKERMERELELARQVQQSLLPARFPVFAGYEIAARNEPARQVGGDFYDVIRLDARHFGLVIADVTDKGMPAALYMALSRSLLLAEARRSLSPRETLLNVNRLLLELGELDGFVSVFYGVLDRAERTLTYTRAGHELPLLLRDGQIESLGGSGAVLGILDEQHLSLTEERIALEPGDCLLLYTDGITDVHDASGRFLGLKGLESILQAIACDRAGEAGRADMLCRAIFAQIERFRGQAEPFDDMTLLVLACQRA